MEDAEFWQDRARAETRSKELADLKRDIARWKEMNNGFFSIRESTAIAEGDEALMRELEGDIAALQKKLSSAERENQNLSPS